MSFVVFTHLSLFLAAAAIATLTQVLTGFAFGLVFIAIVAALHLASLPAAANVVNVMVMVNALLLVRKWPKLPRGVTPSLFVSSLAGVGVGVVLLFWMTGSAVILLRLLLGITVLVCSLLLVVQRQQRAVVSSVPSFCFYGGLSGVMGGLFASAGPPVVFHMYRQPLHATSVRDTLMLLFAVNAVLRLVLIVPKGGFDAESVALSLQALPVVFGLSWVCKRWPPRVPPHAVKWVVFALLACAGLSLVIPALRGLFNGISS
jgi:uncharacterized membrane protein YfcA